MDSIRGIFKRAWKAYRSKWFINIVIVFVVGVLVNGYTMSTRIDAASMFTRMTGSSNARVVEEVVNSMDVSTDVPDRFGLHYTKGVLAVFVNQISSSGSIVFGIINALNTLIFKDSIKASIIMFAGIIVLIVLMIFVRNVVYVGQCRYFMEHRSYRATKADKIMFIYRFGKTMNVAKVMLFRSIFQSLWNITIVGGFIKFYEYSMIPFILAENPEVTRKEAFALSKEMTRGYKRKMFAMDLIYALGVILGSFTYDLLTIFLVDPFRACVFAEIYSDLRKTAREKEVSGCNLLNDIGLDVEGVSNGGYPEEIFGSRPLKRMQWLKIDYRRHYTFSTYILFFFSFSLVGYVWEVFYTLLTQGVLANRGTMTGPWLPIYGCGGLLIMMFLKPLREKPLAVFGGAFVLCGLLEYFASWILEVLFDAKWWDYTDFFLNLNGRICLEGLLVFGMAGVAFTYIFSPMLDNFYKRMNPSLRKTLCIVLPVLFMIDFAWSSSHPNTGKGITEDSNETAASVQTMIQEDQ